MEVVRQPIAGNVHLDLGSDWSGRMSQAAEERALRWAEAGVTRVADLLITHQPQEPWRLMTAAEAADCHTGITEAEFQHFVDTALPRKWQEVLATAPERLCSN